ncbi:MAG: Uma2 family endonuclease [Anaerolineae bacterium]|nr:Uma2 family endonuclease [Anaerolineae bacterium]
MLAEQKKLITMAEYDVFLGQPENEDRLFELINGEIVEKVTNEEHAIIASQVHGELYVFLKTNPLGRLKIEARHRLPADEHNDRIPDISFTREENLQPVVSKGAIMQMPDLAIEIKPPRDSYTRMREKAAYYLANGVQMVWLIFPEKRFVEVHHAEADIEVLTLTDDDVIGGGSLLPGFTLSLQDVFKR